MVVVDALAEVIAALEDPQQLADDVLAQHAVLLAVDEHLPALPVDAEVVDDPTVVAQLEAGVERVATEVVEQVGVDRVADDLAPEGGHRAAAAGQHREHVIAQTLSVELLTELGVAEH